MLIPCLFLQRTLRCIAALSVVALVQASGLSEEIAQERARNLVILDPVSIENLRLETTVADDQTFEQVIFAVGRVQAIPSARAVISSPDAGRVVEVKVAPGDTVEAGAEVLQVEKTEAGAAPSVVTLTSPIAGVVTKVHAIRGESFRRIKTLLEIVDLREVELVARIPEHEVSMLQVGSSSRILVPAACDKIFRPKLLRLGTEGDPKHGTVEAYYRLQNRDGMRPGMRAEFRIVAAERKLSALPREAVQGTAANRYVFVKDHELPHAFLRVPVVTGQRNDRFIEIVRGLMPGDEVVTTGAYALNSAGGGTVDLKTALDAAHGHAHAEDGTPLTGSEAEGEDHAHGSTAGARHLTPATLFFASLSILLSGLLILSRRHRAGTPA
ncbi:MAG: efflux RND transporter periplasmic adaptor subunit [Chthoniobacteraceae bacterium]